MPLHSLADLFLKNGEEPTAAHLEKLRAEIERTRLRPAVGTRLRKYPWGTHVNYDSRSGTAITPVFAPSVSPSDQGFAVTWEKGLLKGFEPTIGGIPISDPEQQPSFEIPISLFGPNDEEMNIYFRVKFSSQWQVTEIEPFAAADVPPLMPYQSDKLALIIDRDGSILHRSLYFDQDHDALNPSAHGLAKHVWRAAL